MGRVTLVESGASSVADARINLTDRQARILKSDVARWRPARKALIRTVGMGKRPLAASAVAAIRPSVAAGTSIAPSTGPTTGTCEITSTTAMYMKKRPVRASGCFRKVFTPSLTHVRPVRAGTMFSFTN